MDYLPKKIFEYNLQMDPPRAARINAAVNVATYDCFVACWDAKYAYWGIRPNQYDTTFKPAIIFTPPFPGYPSGHAAISSVMAEIYSYFFLRTKNCSAKKQRKLPNPVSRPASISVQIMK
jgi:membrane-associated phospholipid phosphatase